jgi:hypothetical protein
MITVKKYIWYFIYLLLSYKNSTIEAVETSCTIMKIMLRHKKIAKIDKFRDKDFDLRF